MKMARILLSRVRSSETALSETEASLVTGHEEGAPQV